MFSVPEGRRANSPPIHRWDRNHASRVRPGGTFAAVPPGRRPCVRAISADESAGYSRGVPPGRKTDLPLSGLEEISI